ncbi:hypothetical protein VDF37_14505, partial [Xanthomonas campestris pv. raphani]|uniref:hypothetical protein n=1 Tax=Xanthomonas campestris TaxID=339 RepID=UPI002B3F86C6|nr:hypothetical protein [Xanthomonas campestris pv. raphani]
PNIWQTPISSTPDSKPGRYSGRGDVDNTPSPLTAQSDTATFTTIFMQIDTMAASTPIKEIASIP